MQTSTLLRLFLWQLIAFCLLVSTLTPPTSAHRGPMIKIKLGHHGHKHGGSYGPAAAILAAGAAVRFFHHLKKHHHGFSQGGYSGGKGHGHSMAGGIGGYSIEIPGLTGPAGNGMGYSFASHDAHLMNYGYEPMPMAWA